MAGPLVDVDTITGGIGLEVNRILRLGQESELEFIVPNRDELDGWEVLLTITQNFDRVTQDEKTDGEGSDVIYQVADTAGTVGPILGSKDLHIRVLGEVYRVSEIPPVPPNVGQLYTLICGQRTRRTNFDTTK